MNFDHFKKVANSLSKIIEDNEQISLSAFASKLAKASSAFPEDHTIGTMSEIVARMSGNKLFISRAEIKDLYKRLYSRNTKFAEVFKSELGQITKLAEPTKYNRPEVEDDSFVNDFRDTLIDPVLANALDNAFGNETKSYADKTAKLAKDLCAQSISPIKLGNDVSIASGNSDVIVCSASFDTPKGRTFLFVPIEVIASKALLPSVFVGNNGPEDFSIENVKNYIVSNAGKKLNISADTVLKAVSSIKNAKEISNVDLAFIKLNNNKEISCDGILGQQVDQEITNHEVVLPKYEDEKFASQFSTSAGVADFKFGKTSIANAKSLILNKLASFGFRQSQISVLECNDNGVVYAVKTASTAFKVPVKFENGKLIDPTFVIANGSVENFSKSGILGLTSDNKAAIVASPNYGVKPSELVDIVRTAMVERNFAKAEDALNVLAESDEKAYKVAFAIYTNNLNASNLKDETSKCNRIVRNATSKYEICSHTNLPTHKVYQDKQGECRPLYHRSSEETNEGTRSMNTKIFF